jgi:hypothetical protein
MMRLADVSFIGHNCGLGDARGIHFGCKASFEDDNNHLGI